VRTVHRLTALGSEAPHLPRVTLMTTHACACVTCLSPHSQPGYTPTRCAASPSSAVASLGRRPPC
jgi:hypothetical protein